MVGFWKRTRWSDLSGNALKVEETGPKGLQSEGRMVMAGKAKGRKAAEVVAEEEEEAVANTATAEAENEEKEAAVETAAKGMGMQAVVAAAAEMVPRKSVADEGTGTTVEVATPAGSMATAAKGKEKPAVAATVA